MSAKSPVRPPLQPPPPEGAISGLIVDPHLLDLGEVWEEDSAYRFSFPIRNVNGWPVKVDAFDTSCNCLSVEPQTAHLNPGDEAVVALQLELDRRSVRDVHVPNVPFRVEVTSTIRGQRASGESWQVSGTVKRRVTLNTTAINFGELAQESRAEYVIHARTHVPTRRLLAEVAPEVCDVRVDTKPGPDGSGFVLSVVPRRDLAPGRLQAVLTVRVEGADGRVEHGARLMVEGEIQPGVRLLPARVFLAPTRVGESQSAEVTLQVPPDRSVQVDHWQTESPDTTIQSVKQDGLPAGRVFRVSQRVRTEGVQRAVIRFVLRVEGGRTETLTTEVLVEGVGSVPAVPR